MAKGRSLVVDRLGLTASSGTTWFEAVCWSIGGATRRGRLDKGKQISLGGTTFPPPPTELC